MALEAGKRCLHGRATTIEDCKKIVEMVEKANLKYTMAETVVYSREYLFVKELTKGELGKYNICKRATLRIWRDG